MGGRKSWTEQWTINDSPHHSQYGCKATAANETLQSPAATTAGNGTLKPPATAANGSLLSPAAVTAVSGTPLSPTVAGVLVIFGNFWDNLRKQLDCESFAIGSWLFLTYSLIFSITTMALFLKVKLNELEEKTNIEKFRKTAHRS